MTERDELAKLVDELGADVRRVLEETLKIEGNFIHLGLPRGIHDDILQMIKQVVS